MDNDNNSYILESKNNRYNDNDNIKIITWEDALSLFVTLLVLDSNIALSIQKNEWTIIS